MQKRHRPAKASTSRWLEVEALAGLYSLRGGMLPTMEPALYESISVGVGLAYMDVGKEREQDAEALPAKGPVPVPS